MSLEIDVGAPVHVSPGTPFIPYGLMTSAVSHHLRSGDQWQSPKTPSRSLHPYTCRNFHPPFHICPIFYLLMLSGKNTLCPLFWVVMYPGSCPANFWGFCHSSSWGKLLTRNPPTPFTISRTFLYLSQSTPLMNSLWSIVLARSLRHKAKNALWWDNFLSFFNWYQRINMCFIFMKVGL